MADQTLVQEKVEEKVDLTPLYSTSLSCSCCLYIFRGYWSSGLFVSRKINDGFWSSGLPVSSMSGIFNRSKPKWRVSLHFFPMASVIVVALILFWFCDILI